MGMFSLYKFPHAWTGTLGSNVRVYKPNYCARSITLPQRKIYSSLHQHCGCHHLTKQMQNIGCYHTVCGLQYNNSLDILFDHLCNFKLCYLFAYEAL